MKARTKVVSSAGSSYLKEPFTSMCSMLGSACLLGRKSGLSVLDSAVISGGEERLVLSAAWGMLCEELTCLIAYSVSSARGRIDMEAAKCMAGKL
jgi:hypothetical protein